MFRRFMALLGIVVLLCLFGVRSARADASGTCQINYIQSNGCSGSNCAVYVQGEARGCQTAPYHWSSVSYIYYWTASGWAYCGVGDCVNVGACFFPTHTNSSQIFLKGHSYTFQLRTYIVNVNTGGSIEVRSPSFGYTVPN